ncbi:MAG: hypothetical protein ACYSUI_13855 [Planctomycetota bacterium]
MSRILAIAVLLGACLIPALAVGAAQTIYPSKDGTLADGGIFGPFDGQADNWDWTFNESSYEGSITLSVEARATGLEHRVVWEYDLSTVTLTPPVSAELSFTIRGAPVWPFPDVQVRVYSYPADLQETPADFSAGPAVLQGSVIVVPYQDPTEYTIDVSSVVSAALMSQNDMVAFRFQVNPNTQNDVNQAFIDALDSDPTTKPFLVIDQFPPPPGDGDGDGDVDLVDYGLFANCMDGPNISVGAGCEVFDFDQDTDVDLDDFGPMQTYLGG